MKMTDEQVNEMEELLRDAQRKIERVGEIVCSNSDSVAIRTWHNANKLANEIGEMIHPLWQLRS